MNEVNAWEELVEEGNADDQNTVEDDRPTFETIRILFQKTTAKDLGEIAKKLRVASNGLRGSCLIGFVIRIIWRKSTTTRLTIAVK